MRKYKCLVHCPKPCFPGMLVVLIAALSTEDMEPPFVRADGRPDLLPPSSAS